jgi:hypothetical protein
VESKDELQTQTQQNARGTTTFVGMFNLRHVVGHQWHFGMGVGFISQSACARLEKNDNIFEAS